MGNSFFPCEIVVFFGRWCFLQTTIPLKYGKYGNFLNVIWPYLMLCFVSVPPFSDPNGGYLMIGIELIKHDIYDGWFWMIQTPASWQSVWKAQLQNWNLGDQNSSASSHGNPRLSRNVQAASFGPTLRPEPREKFCRSTSTWGNGMVLSQTSETVQPAASFGCCIVVFTCFHKSSPIYQGLPKRKAPDQPSASKISRHGGYGVTETCAIRGEQLHLLLELAAICDLHGQKSKDQPGRTAIHRQWRNPGRTLEWGQGATNLRRSPCGGLWCSGLAGAWHAIHSGSR